MLYDSIFITLEMTGMLKTDTKYFNLIPTTALREGLGIAIVAMDLLSVTQSCPAFCDSMDYSMPSFPVLHRLPKLDQTHVH